MCIQLWWNLLEIDVTFLHLPPHVLYPTMFAEIRVLLLFMRDYLSRTDVNMTFLFLLSTTRIIEDDQLTRQ